MSYTAIAVDWTAVTPAPCTNPIRPGAWVGPHEITICADKIPNFPCPNCCYTIIYYDRWLDEEDSSQKYDICIVGIFWSDGINCGNCSKTDIILATYKYILEKKSREDPDFFKKITQNGEEPVGVTWKTLWFYTPGDCLNPQGGDCDPEEHCCQTNYLLTYTKDGIVSTEILTRGPVDFEFECIPPCEQVCDDVPFQDQNFVSRLCEIDCDNGTWVSGQSDPIFMPCFSSPLCTIVIHYSVLLTKYRFRIFV